MHDVNQFSLFYIYDDKYKNYHHHRIIRHFALKNIVSAPNGYFLFGHYFAFKISTDTFFFCLNAASCSFTLAQTFSRVHACMLMLSRKGWKKSDEKEAQFAEEKEYLGHS